MRLHLRRELYPFTSLAVLADALKVTVPQLKKRIHDMEARGEPLEALAREGQQAESNQETGGDRELFQLFHQKGLCLICGHKMSTIQDRQAGWGEFRQCEFCGFSAHENAGFEGMQQSATDRLKELKSQLQQAKRVLNEREKQGQTLRVR